MMIAWEECEGGGFLFVGESMLHLHRSVWDTPFFIYHGIW